ncbi:MAG TPA: hypothetical protein VF707_12310 [Ardenticatenaceae bacterium]|jgi:hypothetical protein
MNPHDLILIALLPTPVDLERGHAGVYRVPLSFAPPALAQARALAFYQPASFGEGRWQVAWWARIAAMETLPRREIVPEEPTHRRADEPYLRVSLHPLVAVEPPKRATKGRRILFVPTTWAAFQAAETLDELVARAPRPIADSPLYGMIQQQIEGKGGIPDPHSAHQKRLFELPDAEYDFLDW